MSTLTVGTPVVINNGALGYRPAIITRVAPNVRTGGKLYAVRFEDARGGSQYPTYSRDAYPADYKPSGHTVAPRIKRAA